VVESIKSSDDWLISHVEKAFCFGCKRLSISALKRERFLELLPEVIAVNCQRTVDEQPPHII
jgi:hypothetical protein